MLPSSPASPHEVARVEKIVDDAAVEAEAVSAGLAERKHWEASQAAFPPATPNVRLSPW